MTSEASLNALAPPVFDGINYQVWAVRMEAYLDASDLWEAVSEEYEVPPLSDNPTMTQIKLHNERRQRKSKAKASLFAAVSSTIFTRIMTLKTTNEIWNFLKKNMKEMNESKAQEQRRLMRQEGFVEGAFQAISQYKKEMQSNNNNSNNTQKFPPCPYYKKSNHPQKKCWWRPDAAVEELQDEQLFVVSCFATSSSSETWLIDSGCTNHMTYDQGLFKKLDKTVTSKVRIGNGAYLAIKGKGIVAIEGCTGLKLISNVLYVPEINQNLLSVGQLLEKGYKVLFDDNHCMIADAQGREVFIVQMKGKGFALDLMQEENVAIHKEESNTMLWHRRLGHFHHTALLFMKKNDLGEGLPELEENDKKLEFKENLEFLKDLEFQEENVNIDDEPIKGTRSLSNIYQRCNIATIEPTRHEEVGANKKWMDAMKEELKIIEKNQAWELVDKPTHKRAIGVKWVYRTKLNFDCSINKHKARLVVKGYAQMFRVDFSETFAPVARLDTIRMLLALATQKGWNIHQMDVKSTFLNGYLEEEIFVEQPEGFIVKGMEEKVYLLKKALYGLKQAPRAWYSEIDSHLLGLGFTKSLSEFTLYFKKVCDETLVVSLYVDDLLVTGSNMKQIDNFKKEMKDVFEMIDLRRMTFFLGMEQEVISQSTTEAEYVVVATAMNQALWIRKLMADLFMEQKESTQILVDNQAAISIANNPVFHGKTKHFKLKLYFLREVQNEGEIQLVYCKTESQNVDILTKLLPKARYEFLRQRLGVCSSKDKEEC
ncbi:Retrovirus-related Pol polyprotein from transposon RE1 [Vitis vinifera]|uniref:Retrovirus-related Pol polyprotein from transposon RE1 n=1 Tax=Vitis vinifera TaxID=29760 RepID=A0A438HST1_VITVI|nr:Retrovirus-related Pol polyprotein from transposon RE1 [Vitis vinifera]